MIGTPGKSAEIVNTYLEALTFASESNTGKIVFVKEEKSAYLIIGAGELKKIVSTSELLELAENKVDKELGKGLSTNDYSNTEKAKLKGIEENAQRNIIEEIDLNGVKVEPVNKVVSINVDTEVTEDSDNLITSGAVYEKLESKQDIVSDLESIREGASKGKTALQSYKETDPIYMADKSSLATKEELTVKQDKLIAGNNIIIEGNIISSTGGGGGSAAKTLYVGSDESPLTEEQIASNVALYNEISTALSNGAMPPQVNGVAHIADIGGNVGFISSGVFVVENSVYVYSMPVACVLASDGSVTVQFAG